MTEAVGAYLTDLTDGSIEISSPGNNETTSKDSPFSTEKITAYILIDPEEPDKKSLLKNIQDLEQFLANLSHIFPDCPGPRLSTDIIMEEDWGEIWKSFFTSFQITPRLIIKPSWEERPAGEGNKKNAVIEMDPGLAFGTGHHASTQLALLLLEQLFQDYGNHLQRVLDVGTGSGILAMACGLYGAKEVMALDNDPDAVETAQQNIARNRLEHIITVSDREIATIKNGFDLIVANITHNILTEMATHLKNILKPRGFLVLSGILRGDQENCIRETYKGLGLEYTKNLERDEWAALQFQKV